MKPKQLFELVLFTLSGKFSEILLYARKKIKLKTDMCHPDTMYHILPPKMKCLNQSFREYNIGPRGIVLIS